MIWIPVIPALCLIYYGLYLVMKARYFRWFQFTRFDWSERQLSVSVIISARNEAENILKCLHALKTQDYPEGKLEIVLVDDHSNDSTYQVALDFAKQNANGHPIKVLKQAEDSNLKKAAISFGIANSKGDIVITTDADCWMGPEWVSTLIKGFEPGTGLVSGPVELEGKRIFQKFQALESMGLIAVGAASMRQGKPNMCNGANLAYRRRAFETVGGFEGVDHLASGDDEFLMHKIAEHGNFGLRFILDRKAIVKTEALKSFKAFRNQRIRWVSKSRQYKKSGITPVLVTAYIGMLTFPILLVLMFSDPRWVFFLALAFGWKLVTEGLILFLAARFFDKLRLLWLLPFEQFFHIIYVLWVGIAGNVLNYEWKGRKVK